jgi:hypothetical protein
MEVKRESNTHVTPLRYLAATDTSGGVERQQKITHAHESPFYHYAQFPHPFAITYCGKNKVIYFLDRVVFYTEGAKFS